MKRSRQGRISGRLALALADLAPRNLAGKLLEVDSDTYTGDRHNETVVYVDHGGRRYEVRVVVTRSDAVTVSDRVRAEKAERLATGSVR